MSTISDNFNSPNTNRQKEDLRLRMLKLYALFTVFLLAGFYLVIQLVAGQLEEEARAAQQALVQEVAWQVVTPLDPDAIISELETSLAIADSDQAAVLLIADQGEEIIWRYETGIELASTSDWNNWQQAALHQIRNRDSGTFITTDPIRQNWLHSFALTAENNYILIQQPVRVAFAASRLVRTILLLAFIVYLAGGLFTWMLLKQEVFVPLEKIESQSQRIRWRGETDPEGHSQLEKLRKRRDQIGSLAASLIVMNQDIRMRFLQLSTLLETSRVVASSLDVGEVLDNILDQVQTLFNVERCAVVVLDQRADVFRIRASRGLSKEYVTKLRIDPTEPNSSSMRALRNQTPIQISDAETDLSYAAFRARARKEGYRSVLAIPLLTYHAPPAVLLLYKTKPYRYSYSELELASSFGYHVSVAMENAALFARTDERLQEQTRRLEAIVESLNDGLILESPSGKVLYCNQQALTWIHLSNREARQQTSVKLVSHLLGRNQADETLRQEMMAALNGEGSRSFDLTQHMGKGQIRDLRIHLFDVTDARGELLGRGQLWHDVTPDKELDRMKSALISTVSHELRTPLAAIKGYVSTLLADDVVWNEQEQQEFLQTISDETDRLAGMVKNLLDMSRIEAGTLPMSCENYYLDELINRAVQQLRPSIDGRLQIQIPDYLPAVWVDSSRMETVIRNLLENAAKYSPPDSSIDVTIQAENGHVTVQVRDYGPGIPAYLREKIFDRFFRVDSRMTRLVGGAGLGLAICKGFVEAHHGEIWATNADPGAAFCFSLPISNQVKASNPEALKL